MQYSGSQQTASDNVASMAHPALILAHWMISRKASHASSVRFVCSFAREAKHLTTEGLSNILTVHVWQGDIPFCAPQGSRRRRCSRLTCMKLCLAGCLRVWSYQMLPVVPCMAGLAFG